MSNYINNTGQTRLGWRVPTQAQLQTATYLLDSYSGAAAAYSLRKLNNTYTGSAIRVRRTSDNTEQNIGFDANGNLDTTSLLSFTNPTDTSKLLDSYSGASVAYSLRKLRNAYSGSAIRVRRSIDNTETNIGFDASGDLDTAGLLSFVNSADTSTSKLLDQYSGAAAAYSLRKLSATYSGSAIRVRRSSDNQEMNIGFDTNGDLDTTSLLSFVGAGNGMVRRWYDQSGGLKDLAQDTAANQPQIVINGSLVTQSGKPFIYFNSDMLSTNRVFSTSNFSIFTAISGGSGQTDSVVIAQHTGSPDLGRTVFLSPNNETSPYTKLKSFFNNGTSTSIISSIDVFDSNIKSININGDGSGGVTQFVNYVQVATRTGSNWTPLNTNTTIGNYGANGTSTAYIGYIGEMIFYTTNQNSVRNSIESNINSYYSIYTKTTNGFVTTWYDQSGNDRNVTQTAPDNQPRIVNAGSIDSLLGKPSLYFDGSNDCLDRTDTGMPTLGTTVLHVSRYTSGSVDQGMVVNWGSGGSGQAFYNMYWGAGMALSNYGQAFNVGGRLGVDNLTVITKPNATGNQIWKIYVNSTLSNTSYMTTSTTLMNVAGGFRIGRVNPSQANTHAMIGYISELVVWPSDMDSQRSSLAVNANSYYSVYNSLVNGFVTKWYDQSGNSRDLIQVTAANQPQISMNGVICTENGIPTVTSTGANVMSTSTAIPVTNAVSTFLLLRTNIIKSNSNSGMFLGFIAGAHLSPSRNSLGTNRYYGTSDVTYSSLPTGNNYITITNNSNKVDAWENGTQVVNNVSSASDSLLATTGINLFDRWLNSAPLTYGTSVSELIVYNSDKRSIRTSIESNINSYFNLSYTDSDAQSFFTASSITDSNQQKAITFLVKSLKNEGLWTKMKAIYPFVGGNATSHRFNLKDPRTINDAFYLTPYGGLVHDVNGVSFNGSNSWYDTNMNAANNLSVNNLHLSFYSRSNANNTYSGAEIGHVGYNSWTSPPQDYTKQFALRVRNSQYTGSNAQFTSGNLTSGYSTIDGYGLTIGSIINSSSSKMYKGYKTQEFSTRTSSTGTNTGSLPSYNISLGKIQGYGEWSNQQCSFISIGDGLTDSESAKLYGIVQMYQIILGRAV